MITAPARPVRQWARLRNVSGRPVMGGEREKKSDAVQSCRTVFTTGRFSGGDWRREPRGGPTSMKMLMIRVVFAKKQAATRNNIGLQCDCSDSTVGANPDRGCLRLRA